MTDGLKILHILLERDVRETYLSDPDSLSTAQKLLDGMEVLFGFSEKMSRDILFHFAFLTFMFHSETGSGDYRLKFFDFDSGPQLREEAARLAVLAKCQAYIHYTAALPLKEKLVRMRGNHWSVLETLLQYSGINQVNIKQQAFKALRELFGKVGDSEELSAEFAGDQPLRERVLAHIMENWEYPVRGFSNMMDDVFASYLGAFKQEGQRLVIMQTVIREYSDNSRRKYASLRLLLKGVNIDDYLQTAPTIIKDILLCDTLAMAPWVVSLFREILNQAYLKYSKLVKDKEKAVEQWTEFWIGDYMEAVSQAKYEAVSGINEYINPQIFAVCEQGLPLALARLFQSPAPSTALQSVQANLLRYARSKDLLISESDELRLRGLSDPTLSLKAFVSDLIGHNNRHIALDGIRIILEPKKDSLAPQPFEYRLLHQALTHDIKNSYPDFRNDLTVILKKFLHRLRNNFNACFKKATDRTAFDRLCSTDADFHHFVEFMRGFKLLFLRETYPDAPYESNYPLLEMMKIIYESYNDQPFFFRKKTKFDGYILSQTALMYSITSVTTTKISSRSSLVASSASGTLFARLASRSSGFSPKTSLSSRLSTRRIRSTCPLRMCCS